MLATVVTGFTWLTGPDAGKTIPGNKLVVDGIGTIFFGEVIIEEGTRRLTLLRLQFGLPEPAKHVEEAAAPHANPTPPPPPPVGGEGTVGDAHSNGAGTADSWPVA